MITKKPENKPLYGSKNLLGVFLSNWRNGAVLPLIRGRLVDLACGDNRLVKHYGNGVGVDIANYGNTDIVVENFYHLPFAGGSVDTVSIIASLNYFENPLRVLQDVHRVLKDDGQLLITMPQGWAMKIWHRFRERHARRYGF